MTSTKFEEIMSTHNMHEKDEFKSIKSLNIFYQVVIHEKTQSCNGDLYKSIHFGQFFTLFLFISGYVNSSVFTFNMLIPI